MLKSWKQLKHLAMVRGESAVASVGLGGAFILVVALLAAGWITQSILRAQQIRAQQQQIQMIASLLGDHIEPLLDANDLSGVRRVILDTGQRYNLSQCRLVLAEDQVLADANPARINTRVLPVSWNSGPAAAAGDGSNVTASVPVAIAGKGDAHLQLALAVDTHSVIWQAQSNLAIVGVLSLGALLLVYHRSRIRLGAIGVIREALLAIHHGESDSASLKVDQALGEEAVAWNRMLTEQQSFKTHAVAERTIERLEARRTTRNDSDAAWDAIPQGLALVNADLTIRAANGAAAVLLRRRREDIPGSAAAEIIKDEKVLDAIRSIAGGTAQCPIITEVERQGESGKGVLRFSVRPVRKQDTAAVMLMIEDITQQRVAEQARNSFIAQVTHELRTPLTNIRLYVETAIDDVSDNPAVRSNCLNIINQESRRLERIVTEMLSVAEIEAGSFKARMDDVYMDQMLEELKSDYAAQAVDKKITLEFNTSPKLPKLQGDRDKIALALHNLIGNALKYTPGGGSVTVTSDAKDSKLVIEVTDTGIGIKPDEADRIFEKFYRSADPRVGKITGTGLGLTLALEVVRLHGGDITLQSELDHGSTFSMTLPIPAEAA